MSDMRYFTDSNGIVFAFEADSADHWSAGKQEISKAEAMRITTPTLVISTEQLCAQIDAAADTARAQVAGDPLRAVEYQLAASEAQAFAAAGYPTEAVPRTVAAWLTAGRTVQQAADSIISEANAYKEALYLLRETRLQAKEQVRKAMADKTPEHAKNIAAGAIVAIEAAVAGVGNA